MGYGCIWECKVNGIRTINGTGKFNINCKNNKKNSIEFEQLIKIVTKKSYILLCKIHQRKRLKKN